MPASFKAHRLVGYSISWSDVRVRACDRSITELIEACRSIDPVTNRDPAEVPPISIP
ncbi:MAG: hypothetical protein HC795_10440 [Coleofasciculaceae cyanobacterium RL_1_1]|nr:hypothetical protein [Coleofasciculaceae cyanobacterium RL_1_1]